MDIRKNNAGLIFNVNSFIHTTLAFSGLCLFVYLVFSSGISWALVQHFGLDYAFFLIFISLIVILCDSTAWYFMVRHVTNPPFIHILGLRVAGDSLTNTLPGGVVLGETLKMTEMRRLSGGSLADHAAVLMMIKFGLATTQSLFILSGLVVSFSMLRDKSFQLFNINDLRTISPRQTRISEFIL